MKILYFGTICNMANYEESLKGTEMPSVAPLVFENALLKGFKKLDIDVDVYSFPMIPTGLGGKWKWWGAKKEELESGYFCTWLRTINFPIIKQFSRYIDSRRIIKKWIKENDSSDSAIIIYSVCPFIAPNIVRFCRSSKVKSCVVLTDLLKDMYINEQRHGIKKVLSDFYIKSAMKYQAEFDSYVYLTKDMKNVIGSDAPSIVMEAIVDTSEKIEMTSTSKNRAIMYAGGLNKKYGISNLLEAFEAAQLGGVELWLFGAGDYVENIKECAKKNSNIKFFGQQPHSKILEYEKKAMLLVNVRNNDDDYTKYSFPSKTVEYMLSGTPVLTTRLSGIPEEYFDYVYSICSNSTSKIKNALEMIFEKSNEELEEFGAKAKNFVIKNKNSEVQVKRIVELLEAISK